MNERIEVGDLVVILRWPCCGANVGKIGRVDAMDFADGDGKCDCGTFVGYYERAYLQKIHAPVPWLKRIPPLEELEGPVKRDEEIST